MVELALTKRSGGDHVIKEYNRTKTLSDSSRRQMVNILVADMTEKLESVIKGAFTCLFMFTLNKLVLMYEYNCVCVFPAANILGFVLAYISTR